MASLQILEQNFEVFAEEKGREYIFLQYVQINSALLESFLYRFRQLAEQTVACFNLDGTTQKDFLHTAHIISVRFLRVPISAHFLQQYLVAASRQGLVIKFLLHVLHVKIVFSWKRGLFFPVKFSERHFP